MPGSMKSRRDFPEVSPRSIRRTATVTISVSAAAYASRMVPKSGNLPDPRMSREENTRPAIENVSVIRMS
ncbi:hypothetical protein D3C83_151540 [compost metagenome]